MKKGLFYSLVISLVALFAFTSCDNKDGKDANLEVTYNGGAIPANGGTLIFSIKTDSEWTVKSSASWPKSFNPQKGTGDMDVRANIEANDEFEERTTTITVTVGKTTKSFELKQETNTLPSKATITGGNENEYPTENHKLTAKVARATSYQWFENDVAIPGATSSTYTATYGGKYSVEGINGNGKGERSDEVDVTVYEWGITRDEVVGTWDLYEPYAPIDGQGDGNNSLVNHTVNIAHPDDFYDEFVTVEPIGVIQNGARHANTVAKLEFKDGVGYFTLLWLEQATSWNSEIPSTQFGGAKSSTENPGTGIISDCETALIKKMKTKEGITYQIEIPVNSHDGNFCYAVYGVTAKGEVVFFTTRKDVTFTRKVAKS